MSNIPKMYKSQFEFIADAISKTSCEEATTPRGKEILVFNIASELSKTNPNFNKELFIKRCKVGGKL